MKLLKSTLIPSLAILIGIAAGTSCKKNTPESSRAAPADELKQADVPVLDVPAGRAWVYRVTVENPKDARTGKPLSASFERTRRFLGKTDPGHGKPPTDCFEVSTPGAPISREYVNIQPEEIQLLGQSQVEADGSQTNLVWLEHPVPFFTAGVKAGDSMPVTVLNKSEDLWRVTRVIGREKVIVPAGEYTAVRLQMFGKDGNVSLRKSYWFTPGVGIVKEERIREVDGVPVLTETEELTSVSTGG